MTGIISKRHAVFIAAFTEQILMMNDPAAPTPVPEWTAQDIVEHLLTWPAPVLADWADVELHDKHGALIDRWSARSRQISGILTDHQLAEQPVPRGPMAGQPLGQVIDRVYCADVFMHTWDLARANGQRPVMDAGYAAELLDGLRPMEQVLRESGQYGAEHPSTSNDPVEKLMAFIGRDPLWAPGNG